MGFKCLLLLGKMNMDIMLPYLQNLDLLMINKIELSYNILGYYINGYFPYCKTEKDIFKLLRGLQKESKLKYYLANEL